MAVQKVDVNQMFEDRWWWRHGKAEIVSVCQVGRRSMSFVSHTPMVFAGVVDSVTVGN